MKWLAALGRRGTEASALAVFIGLALPDLAALARPLLPFTVAILLALTLLVIEPARLLAAVRRPTPILAAAVIMVLVTPAVLTGIAIVFADQLGPGLTLGLFIFAFAPPTAGAAAFAVLMRLDGAPSLAIQLLLTVASPVLVPTLAWGVFGVDMPIAPEDLAIRLLFIVGPAVAAAVLIRRRMGAAAIRANREVFTGLFIPPLALFAVGSMDGMLARIMAEPMAMGVILVIAIALALGSILVATMLLWPFGKSNALALGFSAGNRNLGLIVGALTGIIPDDTWAYFALAQFPIYGLPFLLRPVYRRFAASGEAGGGNQPT